MKFPKPVFSFLSLILIITLLAPAAPAQAQQPRPGTHSGGEREWVDLTLTSDITPAVGDTATLSLAVFPVMDAPDLVVHWVIPEGVELLDSPADDHATLAARQTLRTQRRVRFPSAGVYQLGVQASYDPAEGMHLSGAAVLYFTVQAFGSALSEIDPQARNPNHSLVDTVVTTEPAVLAAPASPSAPASTPCFTIKGKLTRKEATATRGLYHVQYDLSTVPVRYAAVDIREEDTISDDSYGVVYTDVNGDFSQSFCDDDGILDNTLEMYIRVRTELFSGGQAVVQVEDSSWVDEVYEFDSPVVSSGGGTLTFDMSMNDDQSAIFNIADSIYDAWHFWNLSGGEDGGDSIFQGEAEVHYEPGYGDTGSYYNPYMNEITIADTKDPDPWDDSVIIHEWGHYADDWYSCDDAGSGDHKIDQILEDPELSWSEGYSDYWQGAVRSWRNDPYPSNYFDLDVFQTGGIRVDLETYDVDKPNVKSSLNEMSVAAALWDLNDNPVDGQDTVTLGHTPVQKIFTSDTFQSVAYGLFDDTCTFDTYMKAWAQVYPNDAPTAAVVWQNTGYVVSPTGALADTTIDPSAPQGGGSGGTPPDSGLDDGMWWNQVTYVVDNSASMAGSKMTAVKTVLNEAVNDLGSKPNGTQFSLYTFNNTSSANTAKFAGQFFPTNLQTTINGLSAVANADPLCKTYALRAVDQSIMNQGKGDIWLFADGDTDISTPSLEVLAQRLNDRQIHASVALMGICPSAQLDASQSTPEAAAFAAFEQTALKGAAQNLLGPAAGSTPSGLVPYLLTSMNTGGQFLYVSSAQLSSAAEILRAQITHSAGAGRWSDYVSTTPTYQYDKLASWDYGWVDAKTNGTSIGSPGSPTSSIAVTIPGGFRYYNGRNPYTSVNVYQYGYMLFGLIGSDNGNNTTLPNAALPNNALYPLWDGLGPLNILCDMNGIDQTNCGLTGAVYTQKVGNWFVIEYDQYVASVGGGSNTFEVLLNTVTGEIRYQYLYAPNAGTSTIGLENSNGTSGVQVSYNDVTGAANNMGYKFTPAPPQPTKTYTVTVDSMMSNVGFLLTGYSGDFAAMTVTNPHNVVLTCASKGVYCLTPDPVTKNVQYMEVPVSGEVGVWKATVAPGASGGGSFSFSSMAVGEMKASGYGKHTISGLGAQFIIDLGKKVDGNKLVGQLIQPDNRALGGAFDLFDDGLHGDGVAGDGRFGSLPGFYPGKGTGYLHLAGVVGGVPFLRVESAPYTFQPVAVVALNKQAANLGGATALGFNYINQDSVAHCYKVSATLPVNWWLSGLPIGNVCIGAGQTVNANYNLYLTAGLTNSLAAGTSGEVVVGLTEVEQGQMTASDSSLVTRASVAAAISIVSYSHQIKPGGDQAHFEFWVTDAGGSPVADGTLVNLSASPSGTMTPASGGTVGGVLKAVYTSGAATGLMTISAQTLNAVNASVTLDVSNPEPNQITIQLSKHQMPADNTSTATVTALVLDRYGSPVANKTVQLAVGGDGEGALFGGSQLVTKITDANGLVTALLTSGKAAGLTEIRAELVVNSVVVKSAADNILFGSRIMLPLLRK